MADDLTYASLVELGLLLRAGEISSVDLTGHFLDRLETHGPALNAVVTVTRERALREARQADEERAEGLDRGPLHGIPYGAKDLLATIDYPTTWGAEPFRYQHFDHDADVVTRLREAGAVLIGKLSMVELAG
ncbi:MAG TPA: amidase family protein, partial [Thermomicrobiales bacterium]|nr:amidase family protein [Thermomicrobiales bacterium]